MLFIFFLYVRCAFLVLFIFTYLLFLLLLLIILLLFLIISSSLTSSSSSSLLTLLLFSFSSSSGFSLESTLSSLTSPLTILIKGPSLPAESKMQIFFSFKSLYLILKPSVANEKPFGILYSLNFCNVKDFPLFPFPITPTTIVSLFFFFSYVFNSFPFGNLIRHPLKINDLNERMSITMS